MLVSSIVAKKPREHSECSCGAFLIESLLVLATRSQVEDGRVLTPERGVVRKASHPEVRRTIIAIDVHRDWVVPSGFAHVHDHAVKRPLIKTGHRRPFENTCRDGGDDEPEHSDREHLGVPVVGIQEWYTELGDPTLDAPCLRDLLRRE